MKRMLCLLLTALALSTLLALNVFADSAADAALPEAGVYCFSREELEQRESLMGVFLTQLPMEGSARIWLGTRELRVGDAVARADLARIRVEPLAGGETALRYLPFEAGHLGEETALCFHFEERSDEAPVAKELSVETWRNLPNSGTLRASGSGKLSFHLETRPRRGSVELSEDGSFTYTPQKNKVGEDSFRFTVSDEMGRVSAPATVRVTIRKPADAQTFADLDRDRQFEALWMRQTGLFGGEIISERLSFGPERTVSRGDFLAMVMDLAGIDPEIGLQADGFADSEAAAPWLRPYLASALRRGFVTGVQGPAGLLFRPNEPITVSEAAALTARVLGADSVLPAALADVPDQALTRMQAAVLLYEASRS